jgi:hypothetical protein
LFLVLVFFTDPALTGVFFFSFGRYNPSFKRDGILPLVIMDITLYSYAPAVGPATPLDPYICLLNLTSRLVNGIFTPGTNPVGFALPVITGSIPIIFTSKVAVVAE